MGGCVTPAKPKFSTIKQVQIKDGSAISGMNNSAIRYVGNNDSVLMQPPAMIIDQTNSQVRGLGLERPFTPRSSILKPHVPPYGVDLDGRPMVQSVLPINSVGPIGYPAPMQTTMVETGTMQITNPGGVQVNMPRPMTPNIPLAEPFSINPMAIPHSPSVVTVERTSANIPLPGPPLQPQITETSTFKQETRPISPGLVHPQGMPSVLNRTMEQTNITSNYPSNAPVGNLGNNPNIPPNPMVSGYTPHPINHNNSQFPIPNGEMMQSRLPAPTQQIPKIVSPPPPQVRPVTPLQPTINFDRRLLNFDRAMFSTETKTPQLNSFTYNLDLPISGENKVRLM